MTSVFDGVVHRQSERSRIGANGIDVHRTRAIASHADRRIRCLRIRWNRSVLHHAARAPHVTQPAVTHALNPLRAHFDDPFPLLAYWQESRDTDRTHQRVRERIVACVGGSAGIADASRAAHARATAKVC